MSIISLDQIEELRIEKFIFHVVQHNENNPVLLDKTPIGVFENFFLERVKDTLKGNQFHFNEGSNTFQLLKNISEAPEGFIEKSKQLAINFHSGRDARIKPGVFILMQLFSGSQEYFSIIKYDHEQVLTYRLEKDVVAVLEEITNSFTKSKDSLHKSALIKLNETGGDLIIIDKTVRYDITEFFRGFLNVRRRYSNIEMTNLVNEIAIITAKAHKDDLPREVSERIREKAFEAINNTEIFDKDEFFSLVFGPHGNEKIKKTFEFHLEKKNLDGESFKIDKTVIKRPKDRKLKTMEGVKIRFSEDAKDTVEISHGIGTNPTIIKIKTQKLIEE